MNAYAYAYAIEAICVQICGNVNVRTITIFQIS